MKMKIFVDWYEHEIISETEYKERIRQESEKIMVDKKDFNSWLNDNYTPQDIWEASNIERIVIQNLWEQECKDIAESKSDFEMVEIEF